VADLQHGCLTGELMNNEYSATTFLYSSLKYNPKEYSKMQFLIVLPEVTNRNYSEDSTVAH
jgi:hypothetical protein